MDLFFTQLKFLRGTDFRKDVTILGSLGSGNNRVYEVQYNGKQLAMKEVIVSDEKDLENEINVLESLKDNRFLIPFYSYMVCCEQISKDGYSPCQFMAYILMEKAKQSLTAYIEEQPKFMEVSELNQIIELLINGFESLQQMNIAHRDIKPQNILVMDPFQLKVCDVGSSTRFDKEKSNVSVVGTVSFQSPELYYSQEQKINCNPFKSDVFSLGLCFLYIITFQRWVMHRRQQIPIKVYEEVIQEWISMAERITGKDMITMSMLKATLEMDPSKRPDFIQAKKQLNELKEKNWEKINSQLQSKLSPTITVTESPFKTSSTDQNFFASKPQFQYSNSLLQLQPARKRQQSTIHLQNVPSTPKRNNSRSNSREPKERMIRNSSTRRLDSVKGTQSEFPQQKQFQRSQFGSMLSAQSSKTLTKSRERSALKKLNTEQTEQLAQSRIVDKPDQRVIYRFSEQNESILHQEAMVQCDYSQTKFLKDVKYLSLDNFQHFTKPFQIHNQCQYLNIKVYGCMHGIVIGSQNTINTLVIDIMEDNPKWAEYFSKMKVPLLRNLEINNYSQQDQVQRITQLLNGMDQITHLYLMINCKIGEIEHNALIMRVSKLKLKCFKFILPNNKLYLQQTGQWHFNPQLEHLHLDYGKTGISSVLGSLFSKINTLPLNSLFLDITQCYSSPREVCLLYEYLSTKQLNSLTLIFDQMHQFEPIIINKLCVIIPKISTLQHFVISLQQIKIEEYIPHLIQLMDKLCSQKVNYLSFKIDRVIDKETIKQMRSSSQFLKTYKLLFLHDQNTIQIVFYNKTLLDTSFSKCNQGQQIRCSKMYQCIPCTQQHQYFLKQPIYICNICLHCCHEKNDQVQIKLNNREKKKILHSAIEAPIQEQRCMCNQLGICKLSKISKCRANKVERYELFYTCVSCDSIKICVGCKNECHLQHETVEMYISKFTCVCDRCDIFND